MLNQSKSHGPAKVGRGPKAERSVRRLRDAATLIQAGPTTEENT